MDGSSGPQKDSTSGCFGIRLGTSWSQREAASRENRSLSPRVDQPNLDLEWSVRLTQLLATVMRTDLT